MNHPQQSLVEKTSEQRAAGERCSVAAGSAFSGYAEPIGARIALHPADTPRSRLARHFFKTELFVYFGQLANGQTGWGLSFNDWLELKGWKLIGFMTYERVPSIEEEALPNTQLGRAERRP